MWHDIFNSILVGMGGVCVWVFKYHYQRFMAAHDLQRKTFTDWQESVNHDISRLKRACDLDTGDAPQGESNGVDRDASDTRRRNRGRVRDS